ncbi:hypothetical protein IE53DRAFT_386634 [Violaceomyces palustris]|uniref:Uncharacterized protein n=1 Tax=Violaceomyces palustris TaxID=1673888 RepID=A0ACD0NZ09_9BASI|nr:hypothetical protein IE53DRAFT_386634 [Violaceomyces palustris]
MDSIAPNTIHGSDPPSDRETQGLSQGSLSLASFTLSQVEAALASILGVLHPDNSHGHSQDDHHSNGSGEDSDVTYTQFVANNVAVAACTLYAWEFLITIPDEINLYRHRKLLSPQVVLFFLIRYSTIPAIVLPAYTLWYDRNAQSCIKHTELSFAVVQLVVAAIFAWRTRAIWDRNRAVSLLLIALVTALFATSTALLCFLEQKWMPDGSCVTGPGEGRINPLPWFYLSTIVFDVIVIGLSSYRIWQYSRLGLGTELRASSGQPESGTMVLSSRLLRTPIRILRGLKQQWEQLTPLLWRLLYNGLMYFCVATTFNIVNFALELFGSVHSKSLVVLYAPLMCALCQRVLLLEVEAVWGSSRDIGNRERDLVRKIVSQRRKSWEGGSGSSSDFDARISNTASGPMGSNKQHHLTINFDSPDSSTMDEAKLMNGTRGGEGTPSPTTPKYAPWRKGTRNSVEFGKRGSTVLSEEEEEEKEERFAGRANVISAVFELDGRGGCGERPSMAELELSSGRVKGRVARNGSDSTWESDGDANSGCCDRGNKLGLSIASSPSCRLSACTQLWQPPLSPPRQKFEIARTRERGKQFGWLPELSDEQKAIAIRMARLDGRGGA